MSPPKHLWSGDWREESAAAAEDLANRRPLAGEAEPEPKLEQPKRPPAGTRTREPRTGTREPRTRTREPWGPRVAARAKRLTRSAVPQFAALTILAALLVAGAAYGITSLMNSSSDTNAGVLSSTPASTGPISWLGMQIESNPSGAVVVVTVAPGSQAEQAGIEPGDKIVSVNGQSINAPGDIAGALTTLRIGEQIPVQIARGSTLYSTDVTFAGPPSNP
jgi:hypothetical protein